MRHNFGQKQADSSCLEFIIFNWLCVTAVRRTPSGAEGVEMKIISDTEWSVGSLEMCYCARQYVLYKVFHVQLGNLTNTMSVHTMPSAHCTYFNMCWEMCACPLHTVRQFECQVELSFVNCRHWYTTSVMIVLRIIETTQARVYLYSWNPIALVSKRKVLVYTVVHL